MKTIEERLAICLAYKTKLESEYVSNDIRPHSNNEAQTEYYNAYENFTKFLNYGNQ